MEARACGPAMNGSDKRRRLPATALPPHIPTPCAGARDVNRLRRKAMDGGIVDDDAGVRSIGGEEAMEAKAVELGEAASAAGTAVRVGV